MIAEKDYYAILGVPRDADDRAIRLAYRKLAMKYHPDKLSPNAAPDERREQTQKFTEIGEAYGALSDPDKKAVYDKYGVNGLMMQAQGASPGMTLEQAMELYWNFFKVPGWQRKEEASRLHGVYVATAGAITAPVVGVALGTGLMVGGALAGGAMAVGGLVRGGRDFAQGTGELVTGAQPAPGAPTASVKMGNLIREPLMGVTGGLVTAGLGVAAGAGTVVAGGIGGAVRNVKDGYAEIRDAKEQATGLSGLREKYNNPPTQDADNPELAEMGRGLFEKAMSGEQTTD